jgi:hypothetical protein
MDEKPNYDDPAVEDAWCDSRRHEVASYLQAQGLTHGRIGEWPAWHVAPVVSVWAIESATTPGAMGWWVICGDLPTDYISAADADDPRQAASAFASRWRETAAAVEAGLDSSTFQFGTSAEERRSFAPMLRSRAELLARWAADDEVWTDLFDE